MYDKRVLHNCTKTNHKTSFQQVYHSKYKFIVHYRYFCSFTQTREQVSKCPKGHLTPGLVCQPLTEGQWAQLDQINDELTKEYSVRRQMLLTRCDVTVQSFRWSDKVKVDY